MFSMAFAALTIGGLAAAAGAAQPHDQRALPLPFPSVSGPVQPLADESAQPPAADALPPLPAAKLPAPADAAAQPPGRARLVAYMADDGASPFKPEENAPLPDPAYEKPPKRPVPPAKAGTATASDTGCDAPAVCGAAASCGNAAANAAANCGAAACGCGSNCAPGCGCGCEEKKCRFCVCGKLAEPWTLPLPHALKCRNITVGGWFSGGGYCNTFGDLSNGPLGFRNAADLMSDQNNFFIEKKTDTQCKVFDWGYRADYMFGADGPETQAYGDQDWDFDWDTSRDYGSAVPQAYVTVAINDLTIKGGRFYTPIGYEVVPATGRYFYSHSYACFYAEPFSHTGLLGSYKLGEKLTVHAGWTDGWDQGWRNRNGASTILAGFTLTPSEKMTVNWFLSQGRFGDGRFSGNNGEIFFSSYVMSYKLTEKWTYVFQNDYAVNYSLPTADTSWYGINQHLIYKINDCWSFGGRIEWFADPDGARVAGDGNGRVLGNRGSYWEMTGGLNWKPHANVTVRPEVRYDWFHGTTVNQRPFNRGQSTDQLSGGCDVIFTF
jgi:hypothetical protein